MSLKGFKPVWCNSAGYKSVQEPGQFMTSSSPAHLLAYLGLEHLLGHHFSFFILLWGFKPHFTMKFFVTALFAAISMASPQSDGGGTGNSEVKFPVDPK